MLCFEILSIIFLFRTSPASNLITSQSNSFKIELTNSVLPLPGSPYMYIPRLKE